jgi:hypothetical protein
VATRGNNQENIFENNRDREKFFEYLQKAHKRFSIVFDTYQGVEKRHERRQDKAKSNEKVAFMRDK